MSEGGNLIRKDFFWLKMQFLHVDKKTLQVIESRVLKGAISVIFDQWRVRCETGEPSAVQIKNHQEDQMKS